MPFESMAVLELQSLWEPLSSLAVDDAVISVSALWYWRLQWVWGSMMVVQGIDRSTEAKGDTATEGSTETLATVGAAEFVGSQ
jgi:hypothetical protein